MLSLHKFLSCLRREGRQAVEGQRPLVLRQFLCSFGRERGQAIQGQHALMLGKRLGELR